MLIRECLGLKSGLIVLGSLMSALLASSTTANTNLSKYSSVKSKPSYAQTRPEHDRIFQNSSGTGYRAYADAYGTPLAQQRYPVRPQYGHGPFVATTAALCMAGFCSSIDSCLRLSVNG